ncbi:hypothetical protein GobsT_03680 [Gemmata obscuriglobus]|uniref:Uncharacterized protein n=1 Tax=Gemmata obscuriglobus TaxID=114 RepID=A0A2Z3H5L7_9BACT|nr:hypothetical protein [Gemmata obscuriglobus]AWM41038.1 hypothetical protein C1280_31325 [Gemmata obscuriglobus]QEG25641.1 hypothetical protein GobsT_03680 [Gemmata obscuriglobus]VTR99193.1 unnamed protein product [Gemmata obscuriglobus UQM 2246]
MSRKLFAAALFVLTGVVSYDAHGVDVAPPPREVPTDIPPAGAKKGTGKLDKSKLDPEKLKALKEKLAKGGFDKSKLDPEKVKQLKEKFGDKFDPEKLKGLKEKFGKGPGGSGE